MSTPERALVFPADLLARLCGALGASEPASALRAALEPCALSSTAGERIVERALLVGERARQSEPAASASEVQLALGVLLALSGAERRRGSGAAS